MKNIQKILSEHFGNSKQKQDITVEKFCALFNKLNKFKEQLPDNLRDKLYLYFDHDRELYEIGTKKDEYKSINPKYNISNIQANDDKIREKVQSAIGRYYDTCFDIHNRLKTTTVTPPFLRPIRNRISSPY